MNLQDIAVINTINDLAGFESIGCPIEMEDQTIEIVKLFYPTKEL